jgi:hypothetical protein
MDASRSRVVRIVVLLAVVVVTIVWATWRTALPAIGRTLVATDPIRPVDAIAIAVDAFSEGALEAADLTKGGIASRVLVFTVGYPTAGRNGGTRAVGLGRRAERVLSALRALNVTNVERIPTPVTGTTDSIPALLRWCRQHQVRSVILVTNADHSRRVRQVIARNVDDAGVTVYVRPSRYSEFSPDSWWRTRDGIVRFASEFSKLVIDGVTHPISYAM